MVLQLETRIIKHARGPCEQPQGAPGMMMEIAHANQVHAEHTIGRLRLTRDLCASSRGQDLTCRLPVIAIKKGAINLNQKIAVRQLYVALT